MVHSFRPKAVAFSVRPAAQGRDVAVALCYCFLLPLADITKRQQLLQPAFLKEKTCVCVCVREKGGKHCVWQIAYIFGKKDKYLWEIDGEMYF